MNILEVQDLCKTYGTGETEVHALNHVSFSVRKGEFFFYAGEKINRVPASAHWIYLSVVQFDP